jgi:hypothetical protein
MANGKSGSTGSRSNPAAAYPGLDRMNGMDRIMSVGNDMRPYVGALSQILRFRSVIL